MDWGRLAYDILDYPEVAEQVGDQIARMIDILYYKMNANVSNMHLIAHSLGEFQMLILMKSAIITLFHF